MKTEDIDPAVLKQIRDTPSVFVEKVLGTSPYPYQKEFLDNPSDRKVIVSGRQVGKTTSIAWYGIHRFATQPNHNVLFVSPTQRQAIELFHHKLKAEIQDWVDDPDAYGLEYVSKSEIRGTNGSRLKALPAANKGETIRGFTADTIIVDEAAFIEEEVFTSVLSHMLATTDGDFVLAGTPWGESGYMYKKFNSDNWESWRVPSMENPEIGTEYIEEQREQLTEDEFKREILGKFASKGNAALPRDVINACLYRESDGGQREGFDYPPKTTGECYLGVDLATGGRAKAAFVSMDASGHVFDTHTFEKSTIRQIERKITDLHAEYNYDSIRIDQNAIGESAVENLEDEIPVLEGVRFTIDSKAGMYNVMKKEMEEERLLLPNERELIRHLGAVETEYTARGKVKLGAPEGANDDYFDALMLAVLGWKGNSRAPAASKAYGFEDSDYTKSKQEDGDYNTDEAKVANRAWSFDYT